MKRLVVGRPLATDDLDETLLPKWLALPIFASDPLSSVAYATEAALVVLLAASSGAAHLAFPLSLAIAALLAIVVASYRQTVRAYETSGGAYVVAKDNLGTLPSLVAAAALLTDYVLTVAVSVAAGILALTSAAPSLRGHEVALSLACIAFITFANLRGVREAGMLFALPTYAFVTSIFLLLATGHRPLRRRLVPPGDCHASRGDRRGSGHALRPPARVRVGVDRAHRRRGDRERRQRVPPAARAQRREDARDPRRDLDRDVRRRLVARGPDARPAGGDGLAVGAVGDRPRRLPVRLLDRVHVLGGAGADARDPRLRCQHVVSGLSAPLGAARARRVRRAPVHEPRRPPRLLERRLRARSDRGVSGLGLLGERRVADPPLRRRRLHGVHALADGDGAALAADARRRLVVAGRDQRRRRDGDRRRHRRRRRDEVHRGRVDGDRRDPRARLRVPRHPPPLPQDRAAAPGRHERRPRRRAPEQPGARPRAGDRRRDRGCRVVRAPDRQRRRPRAARPRPADGFRDRRALVRFHRRHPPSRAALGRRGRDGRRAGAGVAPAAWRRNLRDARAAGAVPSQVAARGAPAVDVPAQAAAALGGERRGHDGARGDGAPPARGADAGHPRRPRPGVGRQRGLDACRQLRAVARGRRREGRLLRVGRRRGARLSRASGSRPACRSRST